MAYIPPYAANDPHGLGGLLMAQGGVVNPEVHWAEAKELSKIPGSSIIDMESARIYTQLRASGLDQRAALSEIDTIFRLQSDAQRVPALAAPFLDREGPGLGAPPAGPSVGQIPLPADMIEPGTPAFVVDVEDEGYYREHMDDPPSDPQRRLVPRSEAGGFKWDPTATLPINVSETLINTDVAGSPREGTRTRIGPGAAPESIERRMGLEGPALVQDIFPSEAELGGGFLGAQPPRPGVIGVPEGLSPLEDIAMAPFAAIDQAARALSRVNQSAATILWNLGETLITRTDQPWTTSWAQISAVNELLRRQPTIEGLSPGEVSAEIRDIAMAKLADSPDASGADLQEAVARGLLAQHESGDGDPKAGDGDPGAGVGGDSDAIVDLSRNPAEAIVPETVVSEREPIVPETVVSEREPIVPETVVSEREPIVPEREPIEAAFEEHKPFNFEEAVKDFRGVMPEYKEDNSGYNLMLLGAAIMAGESEHWATNVGAGMKQVLPTFIKDRKDREAFMRSLDMGAAKYALGKRDTLENERRVMERTKESYYLDNDITFTDKEGKAVETFTTGFNRLNERQVARIQAQEGIKLIPLSVFLESVQESNRRAAAVIKERQDIEYYDPTGVRNIELVPGLVIRQPVANMKPDTLIKYPKLTKNMPKTYLPDGGAALNNGYFGAKDKLDYFSILASSGMNILNKDDNIAGFSSLLGKGRDIFGAYFPGGGKADDFFSTVSVDSTEGDLLRAKMIRQIARESGRPEKEVAKAFSEKAATLKQEEEVTNFLAAKGKLSDVAAYNTVLRMLAIQMAPILLGESGKTISDGDRRLIANALGLAETQDGDWNFISSSSISEDQLRFRLSLVQQGLSRAHKRLDDSFRTQWGGLGYPIDEVETPSRQQQAAIARVERDPSQLTQGVYDGRVFKVETVDGQPVYTFGP
jgi:hypothetical protein